MSSPEIHLRASAGAIDQMPSTDLERALRQLKARRNARTQMEVLHQQTELDAIELEQAAYQLAGEAEAKGDLLGAARWYTAAAINDFAGASLKLARIFDALAEQHLHAQEGNLPTREELNLVHEACRWYTDALAAGEVEINDLERLDTLIDRHLGSSRRNAAGVVAVMPGPQPSSAPQQLTPSSGRITAGPDHVPAAESHRARSLQDAAGDHPPVDRDQPDLSENHGR
jgi:hypothetical protein